MTLAQIRESFDAFLTPDGVGATDIRRVATTVGGIPACWFEPEAGGAGRPLLYCHGGGFQIGSIHSHAGLMARLALACGARVLGFDYRLAPEHRFPAAADDAFAAYRQLVETEGAPAAIVGDSAGGALALGTAIRARDAGLPLPQAIVLLSPWLDLTLSGDSYTSLVDQDIFSKPDQLRAMARTYLGRGGDPANPAASPVFDDLQGLPPMLVHAGACDITLDDARLLVRRVEAEGGSVTLRVFERMYHHFQVFEELPEAAASLADIGGFVRALDPG